MIVAFGNQIIMEETLEQSMQEIFGGKSAREPIQPSASVQTAQKENDITRQALDHFQRSQEMLRQGNWSGCGEELKNSQQR